MGFRFNCLRDGRNRCPEGVAYCAVRAIARKSGVIFKSRFVAADAETDTETANFSKRAARSGSKGLIKGGAWSGGSFSYSVRTSQEGMWAIRHWA